MSIAPLLLMNKIIDLCYENVASSKNGDNHIAYWTALFKNMYLVWHKVMWTTIYFYLMSFIYKENIMNCIVLVQTFPGSPLACFLDTIKWS